MAHKRFTQIEIEYIKNNYQTQDINTIAKLLNRSSGVIRNKAANLGIVKIVKRKTLLCKKCNKSFPNHYIKNGKEVRVRRRDVCLECEPIRYVGPKKLKLNCLNCGKKFSTKTTDENGNTKYISFHRSNCFDCNPFDSHSRPFSQLRGFDDTKIFCSYCQQNKPTSEFGKYDNERYNSYCIPCTKLYRNTNRSIIKGKLITYLGGKCFLCDYNKCQGALDFHHLNPNEKDFNLSKFAQKSLTDIKNELNKCILICSNCHRELHAKQRTISNEQLEKLKEMKINNSELFKNLFDGTKFGSPRTQIT